MVLSRALDDASSIAVAPASRPRRRVSQFRPWPSLKQAPSVKDLGGLIRLVQWRVDEKRRELGEAQGLADRRRQALVDLDAELLREQEAARGSFDASQGYANYARQFLVRRAAAVDAIRAADVEVERIREELSGLFLELKQAEITQANREKAETQRLAKIEQTELDEIGSVRFQRARKAESGESRG